MFPVSNLTIIRPVGAALIAEWGQIDRRTDMMQVMALFATRRKAPVNDQKRYCLSVGWVGGT